jgi:hypothetical protein
LQTDIGTAGFWGSGSLDGLAGSLTIALAEDTTADVEVELAVVVEPELTREKVIDDPLRELSRPVSIRRRAEQSEKRTHLHGSVAVVRCRDVRLPDGAAIDANVGKDGACEMERRGQREKGEGVKGESGSRT